MDKIKIDLRQLTAKHVEEARPNMGKCLYSAPCIIGTLLTPEQREQLDAARPLGISLPEGASYDVSVLAAEGLIEFAEPGQQEQAEALQGAFDANDEEWFKERLARMGVAA